MSVFSFATPANVRTVTGHVDTMRAGERAADALRAMPEWDDILAAAAQPKVGRKGTQKVEVARALLGLDSSVSEKGDKAPNKRLAALSKLIERELKARADKPVKAGGVMRVSLSGPGGGSVTLPADSELYAQLLGLFATAETTESE